MHLDLSNKVVLVTGAARGIGRELAERLIRERAVVVALDLAVADLNWFDAALAAGAADGAQMACDVRDTADVDRVVEEVLRRFERIDVVINNAGLNAEGLIESLDDQLWERAFDVNVGGVIRMCRAVIPAMKRQRSGRIINAASFAAIVPSVGAGAYAASKAAVVQLTRTLAGELGPWGITANSYAPGMVPTSMNGFAEMPLPRQDELLNSLTLRRWGAAADIADLVCFLASDASSYITGTMIDVSGGKLATQFPQRAYQQALLTAES